MSVPIDEILAVIETAINRAAHKWPVLQAKHHKDELRGTLWLVASGMVGRFDPEYYSSTFKQYAIDALVKHAYGYAYTASSGLSVSKYARDILIREDDTYGCVELHEELLDHMEVQDPLSAMVSEEAGDEVRARLAEIDDEDLGILIETVVHDVSPQDLGREMGLSRQKVTARRDRALARLRRDEDLRDINAARFGGDKHQIDYGHEVPALEVAAPPARFRVSLPQRALTASPVPTAARASLPFWFSVPVAGACRSARARRSIPRHCSTSPGLAPSRAGCGATVYTARASPAAARAAPS